MIERIIAWSIRNRFLVLLGGLLLSVWGVYAVYHTPVDAIPDLSENQVIVFTEWPGHSPREIEDQVTYPLSLSLQGLASVEVVRASSDFNFSMINVIFQEGVDHAESRRQINEGLNRSHSGLPAGVVPTLAPDAPATGQIFWYTVEGPGYDLGELRAIQDWYVRYQLNSVPGVAEVASVGGYPPEYQIEIDPQKLRTHRLTLAAVLEAVGKANETVGGHVMQKANAEYLVRSIGWLGSTAAGSSGNFNKKKVLHDLEQVAIPAPGGLVRLEAIARVSVGPQVRRGVLEKDGNEVVGGVVLMRYGENPLELTRRLQEKILELQAGLPPGVRLVSFYDRTPLIQGAVATVTSTLVEAILTATICVVLVLLHLRTSLIIAITLPLATLTSFAIMWTLRRLGIADIQTNIMSLAGLAISIGVLVDSSIVMAENVMHNLKIRFGDQPVRGDIRDVVLSACQTVGRPIFFSVMIMLLSFLPVFALSGINGKMFRPLAFTKSFALAAVAVLSITLVPALCTFFIKGRLRSENESWVVRSVIQVYRPILNYLLDRPAALAWFMGVTFVMGAAPAGIRWLFLGALAISLGIMAWATRSNWSRAAGMASLVLIALLAEQKITPLQRDRLTPLDESMVMDMPITVPRASVTQSADDLKARDMMFCRFPEVDMVVGKAGRAETPTDPAPMDMIETMINFRPPEFWPKRKLREKDMRRQAGEVLDAMVQRGLVEKPEDAAAMAQEAAQTVMPLFDAQMREVAYQKNQEFQRDLARKLTKQAIEDLSRLWVDNGVLSRPLSDSEAALLNQSIPAVIGDRLAATPTLEDIIDLARAAAVHLKSQGLAQEGEDLFQYRPNRAGQALWAVHEAFGGQAPTFFTTLHDSVSKEYRQRWRDHIQKLDHELFDRGTATFTRLVMEDFLGRCVILDGQVAAAWEERKKFRAHSSKVARRLGHHHGASSAEAGPSLDPQPKLDEVQSDLTRRMAGWVLLWRIDRSELIGFGGELDRVMQMPGWTNVWTMPIQNRVDMLATGVNTAIGIRVLGRQLDDVVRASEDIAAVVKKIPGAADVIADPVRGKGYLEIHIDRDKAARWGVNVAELNEVVETALGGKVVTTTVEGRERYPVRVRYPRSWGESEESIGNLLVPARSADAVSPRGEKTLRQVPLAQVAEIRIVEGPAAIKSENGLPRNYVRLNVRGRDTLDFVDEARRVVAGQVSLPPGVYLEWTGQFKHDARTGRSLLLILPVVALLLFLILYWTYRDFADAILMMLAVPGALAGGCFFQWLFGYNFSITVWVGYIACFGMATSTGIIMLVYLREAVANAGGLENMTLERLRQAVMEGAVHRLRPKLLTEATIIIGLAPMLWATGTGAEVIKPMAAPVLGGILIADEVIDLFLPVLFFWVRRRRLERLPQNLER